LIPDPAAFPGITGNPHEIEHCYRAAILRHLHRSPAFQGDFRQQQPSLAVFDGMNLPYSLSFVVK